MKTTSKQATTAQEVKRCEIVVVLGPDNIAVSVPVAGVVTLKRQIAALIDAVRQREPETILVHGADADAIFVTDMIAAVYPVITRD